MTTYYIVKIFVKAKENHPYNPNEEHFYYYGNGEKLIGWITPDSILGIKKYTDWEIKKYGYRRISDAKRAVKAHNFPEEYWDKTVTVIAETIA